MYFMYAKNGWGKKEVSPEHTDLGTIGFHVIPLIPQARTELTNQRRTWKTILILRTTKLCCMPPPL